MSDLDDFLADHDVKLDPAVFLAWVANTAEAMTEAGPEHFDMGWWLTERTAAGNTIDWSLWDVAKDRDLVAITACGTSACLAGWLVYMAPKAVTDAINSINDRPRVEILDYRWLANTLGIDGRVWTEAAWPALRLTDPARYGMLDRYDTYQSAVRFLRRLAADVEAQPKKETP